MNIHINSDLASRSGNATTTREPASSNSATDNSRDSASAAVTDSLTLSETARLLGSVATTPAIHPELNHTRIAALKHEIKTGSYTIDSMRIAERLQQFAKNI